MKGIVIFRPLRTIQCWFTPVTTVMRSPFHFVQLPILPANLFIYSVATAKARGNGLPRILALGALNAVNGRCSYGWRITASQFCPSFCVEGLDSRFSCQVGFDWDEETHLKALCDQGSSNYQKPHKCRHTRGLKGSLHEDLPSEVTRRTN
jgi:hypothetical protein